MALIVFPVSPTHADMNGDEEWFFYDLVVESNFKCFHRKYGRYPRMWTELRARAGCPGLDEYFAGNLPKPSEALVWKPKDSTLTYKIQFADKGSFRIVALAKGHVVSINNTFRVTYVKTPYHDHGPYECPGQPKAVC